MNLDFLESLDLKKSSLIDFSNLTSGLLSPQINFIDRLNIEEYSKNYFQGIPILLPANLDYFEYNQKKKFNLSADKLAEFIFSTNNLNYIGVKRFLSRGLDFYSEGKPLNKYTEIVHSINSYNYKQEQIIKNYSKRGYSIAAFQTRNLPHLGHEAIINYLLTKVDYVVINPLIGPKKMGDVNYKTLISAYEYIIDKKFTNKVLILPVIANMFYAGPREACHHAIIRKNLGFTHFIVGRDHAGAENIYKPDFAAKVAKKFESIMGINILQIDGAVYCLKCNTSLIKGFCDHSSNFLKDISGSEFRNSLKNKIIYKYADIGLQNYIYKNFNEIFLKN